MIRRTIEHMKTRPHHERRSFALIIAFIVVVILFLAWALFFFSDVSLATPNINAIQTASTTQL